MCSPKRDVPIAAAAGAVVAVKLLAPAVAFVPLLVAGEAVVAVAWMTLLWWLLVPRRQAPPPPPVVVRAELTVPRAAVTAGRRAIEAPKPSVATVMVVARHDERVGHGAQEQLLQQRRQRQRPGRRPVPADHHRRVPSGAEPVPGERLI